MTNWKAGSHCANSNKTRVKISHATIGKSSQPVFESRDISVVLLDRNWVDSTLSSNITQSRANYDSVLADLCIDSNEMIVHEHGGTA